MIDPIVHALYSFTCWHFWRRKYYYYFPGTGKKQSVCLDCDLEYVVPAMEEADYNFHYVWRSTNKWDALQVQRAEERYCNEQKNQ
jgi:hypothetical protein